MSFDIIEDDLIATTKTALTNDAGKLVVKQVAAVPGDLRDAATINEMVRSGPAVFWAFLGGKPGIDSADMVVMDGAWTAFFISDNAAGAEARRRGDKTQIGMFEMLALVIPAINGHTVTDVGTLSFRRHQNLFNLRQDKVGVLVHAASFELQQVLVAEDVNLNAFDTVYTKSSLADNAPVTEAETTLTT